MPTPSTAGPARTTSTARRGRDRLLGGASVDVVRARDGKRDVIDCGQSTDFAIVDRMDRVRHCERSDPGAAARRWGRTWWLPGLEGRPVRPAGGHAHGAAARQGAGAGSQLPRHDGGERSADGGRRPQNALVGDAAGRPLQRPQRRRRGAITDLSLKGGNFRQCRGLRARRGDVVPNSRRSHPPSSPARAGNVQDQRPRQLEHHPRHDRDDHGPLRRHADEGAPRRRRRSRLPPATHDHRPARARATWPRSRRRRRRSPDMRGCSVAADGIRTPDDLHDAAGAVVSNFVLK